MKLNLLKKWFTILFDLKSVLMGLEKILQLIGNQNNSLHYYCCRVVLKLRSGSGCFLVLQLKSTFVRAVHKQRHIKITPISPGLLFFFFFYFMAFKEVNRVITRQISHMNFTFGAGKWKFLGKFLGQFKGNLGAIFGAILEAILGANFWTILGAVFKAIVGTLCTLFIGILTQQALGSEYLWSYSMYFHWQNILWQYLWMSQKCIKWTLEEE